MDKSAKLAFEITQIMELVTQDFKVPLTSVSFNLQSIKRLINIDSTSIPEQDGGNPDELIKEKILLIETKINQMNGLLEHLLDMAKSQISDIQIKKNLTNTHDLLTNVIEKTKNIQASNFKIEHQNDNDFCTIACDKDRIVQVFSSLIGNLIKLNAKAGTVKLMTKTIGKKAQFKISDESCTLERSRLNSLFELFWIGGNKSRDKINLGLALAKSIIEAHQGKIWIESKAGFGTAFFIELPKMDLADLKASIA